MKIHFCTFGSVPEYGLSLRTLCREASESGYFDTVTCYDQYTIPSSDQEHSFISCGCRGKGYWVWKSTCILDMMKKTQNGDIVIYADSGCSISTTDEAKEKFKEWIENTVSHPTHRLSFQMTHIAENWTKGDVFEVMGCNDDEYKKTGQHSCSIQVYMNTSENIDFIMRYKDYMSRDNYHYVSDDYSWVPNHPSFTDHRHDQAILSLMFKKEGSYNYEDHWKDPSFPILTTRRRLAKTF